MRIGVVGPRHHGGADGAATCIKAGHHRPSTTARAARGAAPGAERPRRVAARGGRRGRLVLTCVSDGPDLEAVVLGRDGSGQAMMRGSVLVDCSTVAPSVERKIAGSRERGAALVDAPVSGGSEGAERGTLTVFCGGSDAAVAKARPLLESFSAPSPTSAPRVPGRRPRP